MPALSELIESFHKLLKKNMAFQWKAEQQVAIQRVKDVLSSPQTMISPVKGIHLTLYLTSTEKSIGALLAQEVMGLNAQYTSLVDRFEELKLATPQSNATASRWSLLHKSFSTASSHIQSILSLAQTL